MLVMIMSNLLCVCYYRDIVLGIIYFVISIFIKLYITKVTTCSLLNIWKIEKNT